MTFITHDDYIAYHGTPIPQEDFARFAARACEAVDAATGWQISLEAAQHGDTLPGFPAFVIQQIKLAACAQAEYLYFEGEEAALSGFGDGGDYRIGEAAHVARGASGGSTGASGKPMLCAKALDALSPTGLLYRGVSVC